MEIKHVMKAMGIEIISNCFFLKNLQQLFHFLKPIISTESEFVEM